MELNVVKKNVFTDTLKHASGGKDMEAAKDKIAHIFIFKRKVSLWVLEENINVKDVKVSGKMKSMFLDILYKTHKCIFVLIARTG